MKISFDIEIPTCREGVFVPVGFGGPKEIVRTVQEAERLGYETVWATDFLTPTPDYKIPDTSPPNWYEPIVSLAYCAASTRRIRLGTGVLFAPLRDCVILAKQVATLDQFSGGRFVLGLGIGMCRDEYAAVRPRDRKARRGVLLDECIETLRLLLSPEHDRVEYKGEYTEFRSIRLDPKPIQDPFPIYVPGRTPEALERAVRFGLGIMVPASGAPERIGQLTKLVEKGGTSSKPVDVIAEGEIRIARTRDEAVKAYLASRQGKFRIDIRGANAEQVLAANWIGTPAEVCDKINGVARQGVTHFNVLHIAGDSMDERLEQMQMFSEEIMPHISG
jgi:probable F420-dependent oxidoreductase